MHAPKTIPQKSLPAPPMCGQSEPESALHEAWKAMRFDRKELGTTTGQALRVLRVGEHNHDQGPDFTGAEILVGPHRLCGQVELHVHSDDWHRHGHHRDPAYDSVILHVFVHQGRKTTVRSDGTEIAELCLGDRLDPAIFNATFSKNALPCHGIGARFLPVDAGRWLEEHGLARLLGKAAAFGEELKASRQDWSQVLWEKVAGALGGPVNASAFEQVSRHAHWDLVRRYVHSPLAAEALLFGSCGLLSGRAVDPYMGELQLQWDFLQRKHGLQPRHVPLKTHRMHPAGFPTVRLAQLAWVATTFKPICQLLGPDAISGLLRSEFGDEGGYWSYRYSFGNTLNTRRSELGFDTKVRLVANALVPIAICHGGAHLREPDHGSLLALLRALPPEQNKVVQQFKRMGLAPGNALQSQGMIHLYRVGCLEHRCQSCRIGAAALGLEGRHDPTGGTLLANEP